jgi:hypothetical protein
VEASFGRGPRSITSPVVKLSTLGGWIVTRSAASSRFAMTHQQLFAGPNRDARGHPDILRSGFGSALMSAE